MGKRKSKAKAEETVTETLTTAEVASLAAVALIGEQPSDTADFNTLMASVTEADILNKQFDAGRAIDARAAFEVSKGNDKIGPKLDAIRKTMTTTRAAQLMCVVNFDPAQLNREVHTGSRYNVYAIGKLADAIHGLTSDDAGLHGAITNKINLACMRSLFAFRAEGIAFTGEMAKAAASDKIRIDAAVAKHLVRHTVSAVTAATQASSTMQALETLGVVSRTGTKHPTWALTGNPIVSKLESVLKAA